MSSEKEIIMKIILGDRLKELREEKGKTQKQVAEDLGINSVTYLHYEKSQREPPLSLLADFALYFNVSVDYLLGLNDY
jgi:transcriptional regulator with XRE-family HTH domain